MFVAFASIIGIPPAQRQFGPAVLLQRRKVFSNSRAVLAAARRELRSMRRSSAARSRASRRAENCDPASANLAFLRAVLRPPHTACRPRLNVSTLKIALESDACAR